MPVDAAAAAGDDPLTMGIRTTCALTLLLLSPLATGCRSTSCGDGCAATAAATYSHDVFFRLEDPSRAPGLIAACERLRAIPGVVHLTVASRDEAQTRDVNETWFHVALHVEFDGAEAYAGYGPHPIHQKLLAAFGEGFERVAVYDGFLGAPSGPGSDD